MSLCSWMVQELPVVQWSSSKPSSDFFHARMPMQVDKLGLAASLAVRLLWLKITSQNVVHNV